MQRRIVVVVVVVAGLATACGKDKPSCETANKNIELLTAKLQLRPAGAAFVKTCKDDERVTQAMLDCWSGAKTIDALERCPAPPEPRPRKKSPPEEAKMTVEKYAFEAYPRWSMEHPDASCPKAIEDLNKYMERADSNDPWGHVYDIFCGANLPPGAKGLAIRSRGADGQPDTGDDIKSWD